MAFFAWGSPRVWSLPGVPWARQGGTEQRQVPAPCRAVPAVSVLLSRVPVPAQPRRDVPLGSAGRFPPRRRFPGDCGASARPAPADQITSAARPKFPASPSVPMLKSHQCSCQPPPCRPPSHHCPEFGRQPKIDWPTSEIMHQSVFICVILCVCSCLGWGMCSLFVAPAAGPTPCRKIQPWDRETEARKQWIPCWCHSRTVTCPGCGSGMKPMEQLWEAPGQRLVWLRDRNVALIHLLSALSCCHPAPHSTRDTQNLPPAW